MTDLAETAMDPEIDRLHIVFSVGEADFAIGAKHVAVMESYDGATPVPGGPPYVAGLVNIRGNTIPVIDLRRRFGMAAATERSLDQRVVVVELRGRQVGLLVDRAREVVRLDPRTFEEPPDAVRRQAAPFVTAVAKLKEKLLMTLDLDSVVGDGDQDASERPE